MAVKSNKRDRANQKNAALQTASAPTAIANASDLATAIALVNDLKAKYNATVAGIDA